MWPTSRVQGLASSLAGSSPLLAAQGQAGLFPPPAASQTEAFVQALAQETQNRAGKGARPVYIAAFRVHCSLLCSLLAFVLAS